MFGVAENIEPLLNNSIEKWRMRIDIKREIYQGNTLSSLLFALGLILLSLIPRNI